jgi:hypothetical protein
MAQGNSLIGAFAPAPFNILNPLEKQRGQEIKLQSEHQAERYLIRTQNATEANLNKLDDLRLNQLSTQEQIKRRGAQALPAPFNLLSKRFEANSHQDLLVLAHNQLYDAQQAYAKDHSYSNWLAVRAARDSIAGNKATIAGDESDIRAAAIGGSLGKSLSILGPLNRRQASKIAVRTERRNNNKLFADYLQKPTEDNWWALRLSNVKLKALEQDVGAEQGEIAQAPIVAGLGLFAAAAVENINFQNEENNWKRYNQLYLANLLRKRAESAYQARAAAVATAGTPGSVPSRMLALSSYGQPPLPRPGVPPPRPGVRPPLSYGAPVPRG